MSGEEEHLAAKFMVLADVTRRHIKEEEGTMFKKARKSEIDLDVLGSQMSDLKQKLLAEGAPPDFETAMIAKCGLRGASPSRNAVARVQAPLKQTAA
jgi:hypothetical protein